MSDDISALKARASLLAVMQADGISFVRKRGVDVALCPFHAESTPSFKVEDERYICFGCQEKGDVLDWLEKRHNLTKPQAIQRLKEIVGADAPRPSRPPKPQEEKRNEVRTLVATYEFHNAEGKTVFYKDRFVLEDGRKTFGWRTATPTGIVSGQKSGKLLYNLPSVRDAIECGAVVVINEGEKAVDRMASTGYVGTCSGDGAGKGALKWDPGHDHCLEGAKEIWIIADWDEVGEAYARNLAMHLWKQDGRRTIRVFSSAVKSADDPKEDLYDHLEGGFGMEDLIPRPELEPRPKFKLYTVKELESLPPKSWLVRGVLGAEDLMVIHAAPGAGKTFVVLDLIGTLIKGGETKFASQFERVGLEPSPVVYCAGEKFRGIPLRLKAMAQHRKIGEAELEYLRVMDGVPQLFDPKSEEGVDLFLEEMLAYYPEGLPRGFLVIDTLNTATVGADENEVQDMGMALHNLKRIRNVLGCATCVVHHSNKMGGLRGSTAIIGAADAILAVKGEERGEGKILEAEKMSDAEDGWSYGFQLQTVSVEPSMLETKVCKWTGVPFAGAANVRDEVLRILNATGDFTEFSVIWRRNTLEKQASQGQFRAELERLASAGILDRRLRDDELPETTKNPPLFRIRPAAAGSGSWLKDD